MNDALKRAISKQTGASEEEVEALYDRAFTFEFLQNLYHFVSICKGKGIQRRRRGLNLPPTHWSR